MVLNTPSVVAFAFMTADQLAKSTPTDIQIVEALQQSGAAQLGANGSAGGTPQTIEPRVLPMPVMLTIKELAAEFKQYGVSEHYIRYAAKQKKFPSISTGKKILICRDVFIRHLHGEKFD